MNKEKNRELFESTPVPKAVASMAIPTVIGQLIILIYNMADTFFIGRTNNPNMVGAASLILPIFNITLSLSAIAGLGGSTLVSRLLGERREEEAKKVYSFSVWFSAGVALFFSLATLIFMRPLLHLLGADETTYSFARSYALCVVVLGGLPTILTNVLSQFVRSIGESVKAGFGITMGGIANMLLDPLFMFVLLPQGNEILGAGIATCLSNLLSCLYFIFIICRLGKDSVLKMRRPNVLPESASIRRIFSVGIPTSIATFLFDLDYIVIDKLMAGYSNTALAAVGIVLKAERLPLNVGIGICQGMVPIVAYNYAAGNRKRMRSVTVFSLLSGLVCGALSILLYQLFAPHIIGFFIVEAETVTLGTGFLRVRCLATPFMFLNFFHVHLFNSYGRGKEALLLGISRWAVFNIPMLFLLNFIFGIYGIVWAQITADIMNATLSFIVHAKFLKSPQNRLNAVEIENNT